MSKRLAYYLFVSPLIVGLVVAHTEKSFAWDGPGTLGLRQIVYGPYDKPGDPAKKPGAMFANAHGGFLETDIVHADKSCDRLRVSWKFDRDIAALRAGDEIGVLLRIGFVKSESDREEFWISAVNLHESSSNLLGRRIARFDKWHPTAFGGLVRFAYGRKGSGKLNGKLTVAESLQEGTTGFSIQLNATATGSTKDKPTSGHFEWLYQYEAGAPAAKNVEVKIGNPKPQDRTESTS